MGCPGPADSHYRSCCCASSYPLSLLLSKPLAQLLLDSLATRQFFLRPWAMVSSGRRCPACWPSCAPAVGQLLLHTLATRRCFRSQLLLSQVMSMSCPGQWPAQSTVHTVVPHPAKALGISCPSHWPTTVPAVVPAVGPAAARLIGNSPVLSQRAAARETLADPRLKPLGRK